MRRAGFLCGCLLASLCGLSAQDGPDGGRYPWRGVMLDEARHFFGKETVRMVLDLMATEGYNVFHWHLTDDQGWRIEIRRYPNLTKRGAVRELSKDWSPQPFWYDDRTEGDYGPYFYTREDIREIVAYAHSKGIRIVPEIEMPSHSLAALASYPEHCCFPEMVRGNRRFLHPSYRVPGRNMRTYCIGSDETVAFLENVLDEVCELFPDDVVHIGGDEAPQGNWLECPRCQARMKAQGLKNGQELQGWLMARIVAHLARKGKRTMGWEELAFAKVDPKDVILQCWHGPETARKAVAAGYDVVMSPPDYCYFDFSQGNADDGLVYNGPGRVVSVGKIRSYDPVAGLEPEQRRHVLGVECCNWTEATTTTATLVRKLWPRAKALAEVLR